MNSQQPSKFLSAFPELAYGVSAVNDGNISFNHGPVDEVITNRKRFLAQIGIELAQIVSMWPPGQVGGIERVDESYRGRGATQRSESINVDALITKAAEVPLFLPVADCLPTIIFDPTQRVVALLHLSRACTEVKLAPTVVALLADQYGSKPHDLIAYLGPGIGPDSYLMQWFPEDKRVLWGEYAEERPNGELALRVADWNRDQLMKSGLKSANVELDPTNTATDRTYFSHYRSDKTGEPEGRFAAAVMLKKPEKQSGG